MAKFKLRTNAQIKADNEAFQKLSPAKQRVAIARDSLAQLGQRLIAEAGTYVASDEMGAAIQSLSQSTQLQKIFNKLDQCAVCAKGALFVCLLDKTNRLKIADLTRSYSSDSSNLNGTDVTVYLEGLFEPFQLDLIESAFELTDMSDGDLDGERQDDIDDAVDFGKLFTDAESSSQDAENRLRAILENIVVNKGTFVPSKRPVRRWVTEGFRG